MTSARPPAKPPLLSSRRRRAFLGLGLAGLAAPLLQACGGSSGGSSTPSDPESVQWLRQGILQALDGSDVDMTAVSVAIFAGQDIIWREAFGYANPDAQLPVTVDTRFNVGSVAKLFATLAVMILRDRGALSLDQPVVQLLPSFSMLSPEYTQVTVRHLVNHSSGFPGTNYRNVFNFAPIPGYAQDTLKSLSLSRLKHDPGELSVYCNDGFTLLELVVPALTGQSYTDFIQHELLDPLGMPLTGFALAPATEGTFVHPRYQGKTQPQEFVAALATGGIVSTPTDMMKIARLLLDGGMFEGQRIVSAGALQDMAVEQSAYTRIDLGNSPLRYGLGWDNVVQPGMEAGGLQAWHKNGGTDFFHSDFIVVPGARLALMITGASSEYGGLALAEGALLRTAQERGVITALPSAIVPVVPPVAASATDVSALTGIYANYNLPVEVLQAGDGSLTLNTWHATGWTVLAVGLRLRTDGRWWADGTANTCYAFKEMSGYFYLIQRVLSSNALYWTDTPAGEWLPDAPAPLPAAWQNRLGSNWLDINDAPESFEGKLAPRTGEISQLAERPGYVLWNNAQLLRVIDDNQAGMTVKIPAVAGRDLVELNMVMEGDGEYLHSGTMVFRRV
ncbi:serine hydrolase domain-containing protein [Paraburkholderia sacchari]|uniref:serine hydrolase domain-containing protein n=1 Tax=Paraburkholderia sacchari TaxID=159450 RepID=UPI000543CFDF|nr:serine hydrolase domain-containing protein [Paraburkholderia sacchari]NLP63484.1 beta-lactamase family protein [Paraburkholderia sacchari]